MGSFSIRFALGIAMPLLMSLAVRAAEPPTMPIVEAAAIPAMASSGANCCQPDCGAPGCETNGCQGDCGCGGVHCCCGCGWYGGAEAALLRPYFNNNPAYLAYTLSTASISSAEFSPAYEASPRIWLGYVGQCGLGVRVGYWQYDQSASAPPAAQTGTDVQYSAPGITSAVPAITLGAMQTDVPGDTITVGEHLHMYTLDAEVTQCLQICCWNFVFGGGLRDASVHLGRESVFVQAGNTGPFEDTNIDNNFDGIGPAVFAEFRRPLGCCGFAFVGNVGGSLLYGTKSLRVNDAFPTLPRTQTYDQSEDGCVGVADLSLGIQWNRAISCNTTLFAECLWEGQYWSNMGSSISPSGDSLGLSGFGFAVGIYR